MNKKIKIIELLNKIANGEEIPKKIKHWKEEYTLVNKMGFVSCTSKSGYCLDLVQCLNDEVEILEDNTEEIEELDRNLKFDDLIAPYGKNEDMMWTEIIKQHNKINELVKAINEIRKDLNK